MAAGRRPDAPRDHPRAGAGGGRRPPARAPRRGEPAPARGLGARPHGAGGPLPRRRRGEPYPGLRRRSPAGAAAGGAPGRRPSPLGGAGTRERARAAGPAGGRHRARRPPEREADHRLLADRRPLGTAGLPGPSGAPPGRLRPGAGRSRQSAGAVRRPPGPLPDLVPGGARAGARGPRPAPPGERRPAVGGQRGGDPPSRAGPPPLPDRDHRPLRAVAAPHLATLPGARNHARPRGPPAGTSHPRPGHLGVPAAAAAPLPQSAAPPRPRAVGGRGELPRPRQSAARRPRRGPLAPPRRPPLRLAGRGGAGPPGRRTRYPDRSVLRSAGPGGRPAELPRAARRAEPGARSGTDSALVEPLDAADDPARRRHAPAAVAAADPYGDMKKAPPRVRPDPAVLVSGVDCEMKLNRELLADRTTIVEIDLARVGNRLPSGPDELCPMTDTSDVVILRLWQAVQVVMDLAAATCIHFRLGAPQNYREAFQRMAEAGYLEQDLAKRLMDLDYIRHTVAHAYDELDMDRVYLAAREGPADLRAFLAALAERIQ